MALRTLDIDIKLLPKQAEFILKKRPKKIFAGSFGTGKTTALVYDLLLEVITHPGSISFLGRKALPYLINSTLKEFRNICPKELIVSENTNVRVIRFVNGHELHYHPLDDVKDAKDKIKSANYGAVFIDQVEEITEDVYLDLMGRMRNARGSRQFRAVVNPNGHDWVWKRFVAKKDESVLLIESKTWEKGITLPSYLEKQEKAKKIGVNIEDLRILHFPELIKYSDNPFLPIDYIANLLDAPDLWKNRYVFCEWDAFSGLIYDEFEPRLHIIDPFPIPNSWFKIVGYDHGFRNPASFIFGAIDPNTGYLYIYDEIYESRMTIQNLKILYKSKTEGYRIDRHVADPSIFSNVPGRNIAQEYVLNTDGTNISIPFMPANNDVDYGIQAVKRMLIPEGFESKPKLYFFRGRTTHLIDEILEYRWKELKSMDKDAPEQPRKLKDHAVDALRYLVVDTINIMPKFQNKKKNTIYDRIKRRLNIRPYMV